MKNFELKNYGVTEMNTKEMKTIEGGSGALLLLLFLTGVIVGAFIADQ